MRWAIQSLLPAHALWRAVMDEHSQRPDLLGGETGWPPPSGTRVLALGDLGCLALQGNRQRQNWLEIGQELLDAGCHPLALFPAPPARCTPELAEVWRIVPWGTPAP